MKQIKKILLVLLIVFITGCSLSKDKLTVDYYTYVNEKTIENYKLEEDEFSISKFTKVQDKVNDQVEEVLKNQISSNVNPNISILYNQLIDINTRNNNGLSTLNYYLNLIDSSQNINEFINKDLYLELMQANLLIMIFNLLPIEPLDGGKILKIFLSSIFDEYKAIKINAIFGIVFAIIISIKSMLYYSKGEWYEG